jgi:hypothetical protein
MVYASPHSAEPITIAACRIAAVDAPNFPYRGRRSCWRSNRSVTTQDSCVTPPNSRRIVSSVVETMVWSSAASSTKMRAAKRRGKSRLVS